MKHSLCLVAEPLNAKPSCVIETWEFQSEQQSTPNTDNTGALIVRRGFWGIVYYTLSKEPPPKIDTDFWNCATSLSALASPEV